MAPKREQDRGNDTAATREAIEQGALRDGVQASPAPGFAAMTGVGAFGAARVVTPRTDEEGQQQDEESDSPPKIIHGQVDIVRDGKVVRLPHGTPVREADFDADEWASILRNTEPREATVAEVRAFEARQQQRASDDEALAAAQKRHGIKPSKRSGGVPAGATVIADVDEGAQQQAALRQANATTAAARVAAAGANRGK